MYFVFAQRTIYLFSYFKYHVSNMHVHTTLAGNSFVYIWNVFWPLVILLKFLLNL